MAQDRFMIFTGTANPRLAVDVVNHLDMSLGKMTVGRFSDGEAMVEINENVRGRDVFVLQPTCAPTNDNLMEIMVMVDACAALRPVASPLPSLISVMPVRIDAPVRRACRSLPRSWPICCKWSVLIAS